MTDLHAIALGLPNVEQGIACAGTALESRTYRTADKAFLFVSKKDARLKLGASISEARRQGFQVGAGGWATLPLGALPAAGVVRRWIRESHALARGSSGGQKRARSKPAAKPKPRGKARG